MSDFDDSYDFAGNNGELSEWGWPGLEASWKTRIVPTVYFLPQAQ